MKKAVRTCIICILALALLAGCGRMRGPDNIIDLLSSPRLSKNESRIVSAITDGLGQEIVLKYPKRNTKSSPILMTDLDADGKDEAVVLYSSPNLGANVRMAVLRSTEDGWRMIYDTEGYGTEIYDFSVADFTNDVSRQLMVGYTFSDFAEKMLTVYRIKDGVPSQMRTYSCQDYTVRDVTGDGISDLVYAGVNANNQNTQIKLMSCDGTRDSRIEEKFSYTISMPNSRVTGLGFTRTELSETGAFLVDYYDTYKRTYTQAFAWNGGDIAEILPSNVVQKIWAEDYPLYSRDVDRDGSLETPTIIESELAGDDSLRFMEWTDFVREQPKRKMYGVCDVTGGIYYPIPDEWQDLVRIERNEDGSWSVIAADNDRQLIRYEMLPHGEAESGENGVIVTQGLVRTRITFDSTVNTIQRNYISTRFFRLR